MVRENNFYYLFVALLLLVFVTPIVTDLELFPPAVVRTLGFTTVLAIGVWSLKGCRRTFSIGMFLAVTGIVVSIAASTVDSAAYGVASMSVFIAFLAVSIVEALRKVALSREVSPNRLVGAVCVYLMLGSLWAVAYSMLYLLSPESFRLPEGTSDAFSMAHWNYYSFVTLTTLGYGEIVPVSATARTLAFAEAVFGQLYIAILVAGLVSAYISARQNHDRR